MTPPQPIPTGIQCVMARPSYADGDAIDQELVMRTMQEHVGYVLGNDGTSRDLAKEIQKAATIGLRVGSAQTRADAVVSTSKHLLLLHPQAKVDKVIKVVTWVAKECELIGISERNKGSRGGAKPSRSNGRFLSQSVTWRYGKSGPREPLQESRHLLRLW